MVRTLESLLTKIYTVNGTNILRVKEYFLLRVTVTQPKATIANIASRRTSPDHSRHSCNECYAGDILQCARTSQKHNDAAVTSELPDVPERS